MHSVNLCADELSRQVKRHRDKRRARRESRAVVAASHNRRSSTQEVFPAQ